VSDVQTEPCGMCGGDSRLVHTVFGWVEWRCSDCGAHTVGEVDET
jgi:hypothetical protein